MQTRGLTPGGAIGDADLFVTRQGADTEDKSVTGSQIKTYAATPPGGSDTQIQFNNAGAFGGLANATAENGCIRLPNISTPTAPAAGGNLLFGRSVGGRSMPAAIGPSGLDTVLQPLMARNKVGMWLPSGNGTNVTLLGMQWTTTGTSTGYNITTANGLYGWTRKIEYNVTSASASAVAGVRSNTGLQYGLGNAAGRGGFTFIMRWACSTGVTNSSHRAFCGFHTNTGAASDVNPSTLTNMIGMAWDAADTNIQFMHNDGSGTATKIDLGANFPKPSVDRSTVYECALFSAPNSQTVSYEIRDLTNNYTATGSVNSDLPANTQLLCPQLWRSVGGVSSVIGVGVISIYIETDY